MSILNMTIPINDVIKSALWANEVQKNCLLECDGDISLALTAAEYIVSTQPIPEDYKPSVALDHTATKPGMDIDIGQPKSVPGPAFPVDPDEYPRNKSNQYINKKLLAKAAKSPEEHQKLIDKIPLDQHYKLNNAISHLQSGGTVNHPSENPKLGVDISGEIAHPEWRYYQWRLENRNEWTKRNTDREKRRSNILESTKLVRDNTYLTKLQKSPTKETLNKFNTYLDDVIESLESISTNDSQLRELDRIRYTFDTDSSIEITKNLERNLDRLQEIFEDILEEEHKRLDEEEESDVEPSIPEEPKEEPTSPSFSLQEINVALATQVTWSPYTGPRGGKGWKSSTGRIIYGGNKPSSREGEEENGGFTKGSRRPIIRRDSSDTEETTSTQREVDEETTRSEHETVDRVREGQSKPTSPKVTKPSTTGKPEPTVPTIRRTPTEQRAILDNLNSELDRYANSFTKKRQLEVAEWFTDLKEHVNTVGVDKALAQITNDRQAPVTTTIGEGEKVQYKGTGYFEGDKGLKFLESYLDEVGITLVTGNRYNPNKRLIASAPIASAQKAAKEGDLVVSTDPTTVTKLDESKLLPGLESSEDVHTLVGHQVNNFTQDVTNKFDEVYGKGKWIVKSYGDQAYAGFGVLFPQRLKEIQRSSKQTIYENSKALKKLGYSISRNPTNKQVDGIINDSGKLFKFGSADYSSIDNPKIKRLASQIEAVAPDEQGARLTTTPEDALRQDYGILLKKNSSGIVTSLIDSEGVEIPYNSPKWRKMVADEYSNIGKDLERAVYAAKDKAKPDARFMVQPAFKAVGVSDLDRALGFTWETSNEGRVHVYTNNGKASVIPYATLAGRADAFPVVFANDDIRAMEKAVQDAIDALPESERSGQVYAPDVIKTTEGWKVVELNGATEFGESLWLEENPFVIDAYVSHLVGRKPNHVQFIQGLLQGEASKLKGLENPDNANISTSAKTPKSKIEELRAKLRGKTQKNYDSQMFSTDAQGKEHAPAGSGKGGQFVKKGGGGSSINKSTNNPDKPQHGSRKIPVEGGKGNVVTATKTSISGAVRGALIGFKAGITGKPEMVSREEHNKIIEKALTKLEKVIVPTPQEIAENQEGIARLGANKFRRNLVGNTTDRKRRRDKLLQEFGDGVRCPCVYCGILIGHGTMEQDKIYTTEEGGRYRMSNLVPSCGPCNKRRSDMSFTEAMDKVVSYAGDKLEYQR